MRPITEEQRRISLLRLQRARRLRVERAGQRAARHLSEAVTALVEILSDAQEKTSDRLKAAGMLLDLASREPKGEPVPEQHLHLHGSPADDPSEAWAEKVRKLLALEAPAQVPVNGKNGTER